MQGLFRLDKSFYSNIVLTDHNDSNISLGQNRTLIFPPLLFFHTTHEDLKEHLKRIINFRVGLDYLNTEEHISCGNTRKLPIELFFI